MSRVLKRPMFKMGGSTENVGIMDGMRQNYQNGDKVNQILSDLDKRAPRADPGVYDFLQNFGLNILSSPSQGNIFQTAAVAARDPAMMLQQGRAARAAERRQIAASVLAGEREFEQKKELLGMEIEGRGDTGYAKEAMENFPNDPRSVAIEKQKILDNTPGVNTSAQFLPSDAKSRVATLKTGAFNPGTIFTIVNDAGQLVNSPSVTTSGYVRFDGFDGNTPLLTPVKLENGQFVPISKAIAPDEDTPSMEPMPSFGLDIDDPQA
jgi:hypothetical protein|tara:strand:- start:246 stop:1040 length:795 start_codon:yes stop_codon:yes gene_type:complete